jgi:hypothetical protein
MKQNYYALAEITAFNFLVKTGYVFSTDQDLSVFNTYQKNFIFMLALNHTIHRHNSSLQFDLSSFDTEDQLIKAYRSCSNDIVDLNFCEGMSTLSFQEVKELTKDDEIQQYEAITCIEKIEIPASVWDFIEKAQKSGPFSNENLFYIVNLGIFLPNNIIKNSLLLETNINFDYFSEKEKNAMILKAIKHEIYGNSDSVEFTDIDQILLDHPELSETNILALSEFVGELYADADHSFSTLNNIKKVSEDEWLSVEKMLEINRLKLSSLFLSDLHAELAAIN